MTFKQKNTAVTLINFILILSFFLLRISQLIQNDNFAEPAVFRLWGIIIALAVLVSIFAIILTHIATAILKTIRTGDNSPDIDDMEDERDKLIDLKGTQATHTAASFGVLIAMLSYVFGQPALVMFSLLIFFGVLSQIIGDVTRLALYQRGV